MKMRQRRIRRYVPSVASLDRQLARAFVRLFEAHADYQREMVRTYMRDCVRGVVEAITKIAVDGLIGRQGGASVSYGPTPRKRWW